ncbi:hypothetical protein CCR75_005223 [Bremia lactucae]|uniref:DNA repair protein RAD51 homolog 3 n=1 Tax=Bremia lactucae TaxID=4779 RepID=A0A976FG83_BRELC|nr:hypothetical protein CCR75_005223 [Bremia lactucae]
MQHFDESNFCKRKSDGNMDVPLAACGLAPSVMVALFRAGFRYQKDLVDISARELANEAKIDVKDAVEVLELARSKANRVIVGDTALDLLQKVTSSEPITTRLLGIDRLLGGGLQRGEIIEICEYKTPKSIMTLLNWKITIGGGPGTGKTQFGIHACLAAQFLQNTSGKPSSAVFIDSEGSFIIERVASMAEHCLADFSQLGASRLTRDDLLRGITYYRVHDFVEQMEVLHSLPSYFKTVIECKLVVIDTIAFHFRHGFEDYNQRTRALDDVASLLNKLATDFNVASCHDEGIDYRPTSASIRCVYHVPLLECCSLFSRFLGESWAHSIENRVLFEWKADCRVARLMKSATLPHDSAFFEVSERGVRDKTDDTY